MELLASIAKRDISVAGPEPMGGYWGRDGACPPCRDELSCRVLYLAAGGKGALIIALDLIGVSARFASRVREAACAAAKQPGLTPAQCLVCCSHTHNGPQTHEDMVGFGHASAEYMDSIVAAASSAAAEAVSRARPDHFHHAR